MQTPELIQAAAVIASGLAGATYSKKGRIDQEAMVGIAGLSVAIALEIQNVVGALRHGEPPYEFPT